MILLFQLSGGLVLLLWFLTLHLPWMVKKKWCPPMDPHCSNPSPAASPTATVDTILVEKSFWCASLQVFLNLLTLKCANLPNWLGLLTHTFALFTGFLLSNWPEKSILMHLCN